MRCAYCGCTDARACPGGCSWHRPGYCSACAEKHLTALVDAAMNFTPITGVLIGGRECTVQQEGPGLTVVDHIGCPIFQVREDGVYLAQQYGALELLPLFQEKAVAA